MVPISARERKILKSSSFVILGVLVVKRFFFSGLSGLGFGFFLLIVAATADVG
jgi:hypothetical protein